MSKESKKIPPPSSSESTINAVNNRLFFRLVQCSNLYERGVQQHLNVSSVQGAVLGALSRNADRSMSFADLVEYLAVSRQNLDAVLKRLERLGYVKSRGGPGRPSRPDRPADQPGPSILDRPLPAVGSVLREGDRRHHYRRKEATHCPSGTNRPKSEAPGLLSQGPYSIGVVAHRGFAISSVPRQRSCGRH